MLRYLSGVIIQDWPYPSVLHEGLLHGLEVALPRLRLLDDDRVPLDQAARQTCHVRKGRRGLWESRLYGHCCAAKVKTLSDSDLHPAEGVPWVILSFNDVREEVAYIPVTIKYRMEA